MPHGTRCVGFQCFTVFLGYRYCRLCDAGIRLLPEDERLELPHATRHSLCRRHYLPCS